MNGFDRRNEFDRVWQRVVESSAAAPPPPPPPVKSSGDTLRAFMQQEAQFSAVCGALWRKAGNFPALREVQKTSKAHLRRLRTAYFIQTGETYAPQTVRADVRGVTRTVREQIVALRRCGQDYLKASANEQDAELSALYRTLSAETATQAERLSGLLERLMG